MSRNSIAFSKLEAEQAISQAQQVENNDLDPSLPTIVNQVGAIFHHTRDQVLQCAYEASRALQFWSLSNTNFFAESLNIGDAGMVPSDITFSVIQSSLQNQWLSALSDFSTNPTKFPNLSGEEGAIIQFDDVAILETLKKQGGVLLSIPAIRKGESLSPQWQNQLLYNQSNIRLLNVHVWLDGAKVIKDGQAIDDAVQVTIVHQGRETLVSPQNDSYQFSHKSVTKTFTYKSESKEIEIEANFGDLDINDPTRGKNFALIGPFTDWLVKVERTASTNPINLVEAVRNNQVKEGAIVEIDSVKYTVKSIDTKGDTTTLVVTLFGMPKTYTIEGKKVVDSDGNMASSSLFFPKANPNAKHVDLSNVTAIRMEFSGTFYTFT